MRGVMKVNFGTRVRLKKDYVIIESDFVKEIRRGSVPGFSISPSGHRVVVPKGAEGVVSESQYMSIFNLAAETPVVFDLFGKGDGVEGFSKQYIHGIPDGLLEPVENKIRATVR